MITGGSSRAILLKVAFDLVRRQRLKGKVGRSQGNPPCAHFTVGLEQTDTGYLQEPISASSAGVT